MKHLLFSAFELDKMEGVIPARSKQLILVTFKPALRVSYQCTVTYDLLDGESKIYNIYFKP